MYASGEQNSINFYPFFTRLSTVFAKKRVKLRPKCSPVANNVEKNILQSYPVGCIMCFVKIIDKW